MKKLVRNILLVFSAGCAGGLANSIALWLLGLWGVTQSLGVNLAPALTPAWLYPRIVWGGIWGVLFLLPLLRQQTILRAFIFSMGPTMVQLFIIFPFKANKGFMGTDLGAMTPLFVIFLNFIWGLKAAILLKIAGKD